MTWYKLIFKQNQPIHIGSTKWGVVKETDLFISGQTMWGALTNAYYQKNSQYDENDENKFKTISNFFPSFDGKNILKPSYKDGEFHLGDFSEEEFRAYFVDTYVQTAVEPINRKAKDKSLHEIDYILPRPKREFQNIEKLSNLQNNLHWIGIVFIDEDIDFLKEKPKIYVGSDVRYGFGELELVELGKDIDEKFWWIEGDKINIEQKEHSPYFIELNINSKIEFEGEVLPIVEMDFQKNTPKVNKYGFYINVGSKINSLDGAPIQGKLEKGKIIFSQ